MSGLGYCDCIANVSRSLLKADIHSWYCKQASIIVLEGVLSCSDWVYNEMILVADGNVSYVELLKIV